MLVRTNFADTELPEGSGGEVATVHEDPGTGIDIRFGDGPLMNILGHGLNPAPRPEN
ncbi:hypothetical protein ACFYW1_04670 [Streptomyces sp. NPDC002669]|uniref:hypothetical protein n=1 Tax=Streptomyces sp. NPDC002669 TaxID=3364658 RepID=UPI00368A06AE